jgi:ABC-type phosphate transport system substrate-binding protein
VQVVISYGRVQQQSHLLRTKPVPDTKLNVLLVHLQGQLQVPLLVIKLFCADGAAGIDIGNLSREFKATEATLIAESDNQYQCAKSSRIAIKVPVAVDGLTVIVKKNGKSWNECLKLRPGGLSAPELRWIFSNLTTLEPNKDDIKNNDGIASTKLWSELDSRCTAVAIIPIGPSSNYGTHDYFKEILFTGGPTEGFRSAFQPYPDNSDALRDKVFNTEYSIGFLGYSYYDFNDVTLQGVPIEGVTPTITTLLSGQYQLFTRRIYSMYWKDDTSLGKTKCYNTFIFTTIGELEINGVFLIPIPREEWPDLRARVPGKCDVVELSSSPTPRPTPKPVCTCYSILFRLLRLCCT